jgi:hypothetical protein
MCGRTEAKHGVDLVADHSRMGSFGASEQLPNLWAVCEECDAGRRAYFSSLGVDAETLRNLAAHGSVHVRIGELLRTFGVGVPVPASLIEAIADQSDWRQRLRELRCPAFGWKIECRINSTTSGWRRVAYALVSDQEWPPDPSGAVRQFRNATRGRK